MSASPIKLFAASLIIAGLALPVSAQNTNRDASFIPEDAAPASPPLPAFSGLAEAPPELPPPASTSSVTALTATGDKPAADPASPTATPDGKGESIGLTGPATLGADIWNGTPRIVAEKLLAMATATNTPALNDLMRRLLLTVATPPAGESASAPSVTALRIEKLADFGDGPDAWLLASRADHALIDDIAFHRAADIALAWNGDTVCPALSDYIAAHNGADWQKDLLVCQLRAKDTQAAQKSIDQLRAQPSRDDIFLEVASHAVAADGKPLPHQLTPMTAPLLALLRLSGQPLPGELYGHPDNALAPALLHAPARQEVAQLGLAEHLAERGLIDAAALENVYRGIVFAPEALAAPLTASESGSRLRALLYQSAAKETDSSKRVAETVKFLQSASPAFLNGAGAVLADMLGTVAADNAQGENALAVTQIYMLAGRGDRALEWLQIARLQSSGNADLMNLWPQFALAGLESGKDYAADLDQWLDAALSAADMQADRHAARDNAAAALLLLDAAGLTVPDSAWAKTLTAPHNEKHVAFSPELLARLQAAGGAGRRAETILLSVALASANDIPLPVAVAITRALRAAGYKSEAANFARQVLALAGKTS